MVCGGSLFFCLFQTQNCSCDYSGPYRSHPVQVCSFLCRTRICDESAAFQVQSILPSPWNTTGKRVRTGKREIERTCPCIHCTGTGVCVLSSQKKSSRSLHHVPPHVRKMPTDTANSRGHGVKLDGPGTLAEQYKAVVGKLSYLVKEWDREGMRLL